MTLRNLPRHSLARRLRGCLAVLRDSDTVDQTRELPASVHNGAKRSQGGDVMNRSPQWYGPSMIYPLEMVCSRGITFTQLLYSIYSTRQNCFWDSNHPHLFVLGPMTKEVDNFIGVLAVVWLH